MNITFKLNIKPYGAFSTIPCFVKFKTNAESIEDLIQQEKDMTLEHEVIEVTPCFDDDNKGIDFNDFVTHDRADNHLQLIFAEMASKNLKPDLYE